MSFGTEYLHKRIAELESKIEDIQEWAFNMECMLEDCTYMSLKQFDRDAKTHLESLVKLVGKWIPPELRPEFNSRGSTPKARKQE